jgi:hypothetical protein
MGFKSLLSLPVSTHLVGHLQSLLQRAVVLGQCVADHGCLKSGFVDQQGGTSASLDQGRTRAGVTCSVTAAAAAAAAEGCEGWSHISAG